MSSLSEHVATSSPARAATTATPSAVKKKKVLKNFPAVCKDNFRIYHEPSENNLYVPPRNVAHRSSVYPTTSDTPVEQRIVNEPKPQVTLRYLTVRGQQYSLQSVQKATNSTKKRRTQTSGAIGASKVSA